MSILTIQLEDWKSHLDIGSEPETVTNPFTEVSCVLCPEAVAVYDLIKGLEVLLGYGDTFIEASERDAYVDTFDEALAYFADNWINEYMTLLD